MGTDAAGGAPPHPVTLWLARFQADTDARAPGDLAIPQVGYRTAMFQLAYCLYLLEHNDRLPEILVKRLRIPVQFRPALYETIVAAAFALAGYRIEGAETKATRANLGEPEPTPEFYAIAKSGRRYAVEAKRRDRWRAPCDIADDVFRAELKAWVRRKLFDASAKRLVNPIYWLELSIAVAMDETFWRVIGRWVREAVDSAEADLGNKIDPPAPAYVFVTNNPQLVDDDFPAPPVLAVLEPFLMDDFRAERNIDLEAGFEMKDRHRDVTWVLECLSAVHRVPMTFDGSVPELRDPDGKPVGRLRIGSRMDLTGSDGGRVSGVLVDIASAGTDACLVIRDAASEHIITNVTLTPASRTQCGSTATLCSGNQKRGARPSRTCSSITTGSSTSMPASTARRY